MILGTESNKAGCGGVRRAGILLAAILLLAWPPGTAGAGDDFADMPFVSAAVNQLLEYERDGTSLPWSNPETGNSGEITVETTFFRDPQTPCRTYRRTTERADGSEAMVTGTGCRLPRGVWRLNEEVAELPELAESTSETTSEPAPASGSAAVDEASAGGEPTSILLTSKPEPAAEGASAADGGAERRDDTMQTAAWTPPVPRPKPQIAVIVSSMPSQSDE